jgi:glutaconate CoA-transferase subunit B
MAELEADVDAAWRMAFLGARQIAAQETVFVGIGAPCQAAMLARRLGNADMTMIFESGVIGADPQEMPLSTGSQSVAKGAKMTTDMLGVFALLQRGGIGLGILSGAEVDAAGNLNSTVLGSYAQPRLRLPGSGGAHDIALLCRRLMILMPHDPRRFVERVDFVTSPGHGPYRARQGLGAGPAFLVTTRAVLAFRDGKPVLVAHFADLTAEQAIEGIAWNIAFAPEVERIAVPDSSVSDIVNGFSGGMQ